jgi:glucose-6-phosphate isomerase
MTPRPDILLDFGNMTAEEVGSSGVKRSEIEALKPEIEEIHRGLENLRRLGQLPFQELPYHDEMASRIVTRAKDLKERFESILLLGIGGSSLGTRFLIQALAPVNSRRVIICDHLDSEEWMRIGETLDFKKTLVVVISKSGRTLETMAAFLFFKNCLKARVGEAYKHHLFIITDPTEGPLRKIARQESIESFESPPGVGGRFSVLTPVGLFPAALCGINIGELLAGARRMDERCKNKDPWHNPAIMSALLHFILDKQRNHAVRVLMTYHLRLK